MKKCTCFSKTKLDMIHNELEKMFGKLQSSYRNHGNYDATKCANAACKAFLYCRT